MKKLIICRHGNYGRTLRLDATGQSQMVRMAAHLRPHVVGRKTLMISSTAPRAIDSADVLSVGLGLEGFEESPVLWSDGDHPQDNEKAHMLILERSADIDVLIVMTHLEYAGDLSFYYASILGLEAEIENIDKGEAWIIDYAAKTTTRVRKVA